MSDVSPTPQMQLFDSLPGQLVPANVELAAASDRRTVAYHNVLRDSATHDPGKFALYAVIDFSSQQIEAKLAVVDGVTEGHQELGLCFLNLDGSFKRFSGGRLLPISENDMNRRPSSAAEVILRIGSYSLIDDSDTKELPK